MHANYYIPYLLKHKRSTSISPLSTSLNSNSNSNSYLLDSPPPYDLSHTPIPDQPSYNESESYRNQFDSLDIKGLAGEELSEGRRLLTSTDFLKEELRNGNRSHKTKEGEDDKIDLKLALEMEYEQAQSPYRRDHITSNSSPFFSCCTIS